MQAHSKSKSNRGIVRQDYHVKIFVNVVLLLMIIGVGVLTRNTRLTLLLIFLWGGSQALRPKRLFFISLSIYPMAFWLNTKNSALWPLPMGLDDVIAAVIFTSILLDLLRKRRVPRQSQLVTFVIFLMAIFVMSTLISILVLSDPFVIILRDLSFSLHLLIPIFVIRTPEDFEEAIKWLLVGLVMMIVSALFFSYTPLGRFIGTDIETIGRQIASRSLLGAQYASTGLMGGRSSFSLALAFPLPFLLLYFLVAAGNSLFSFKTIFFSLFICMVFWSVIISSDRSTWLIVIAIILILLALILTRGNMIVGLICTTLIIYILLVMNSKFISDLFSSIYLINPQSIEERLVLNREGIAAFFRQPLFGCGADHARNIAFDKAPHNYFIFIAVQNGIFKLISFTLSLALLAKMSWKIFNSSNSWAHACGTCFLAGLMGIFIELNIGSGVGHIVWVFFGLIAATYNILVMDPRLRQSNRHYR